MKTIKIEIELNDVESWGVNWDDELDKKLELKKLNQELKTLIHNHLGILHNNIYINSKL
jgi:hypothetical protein